jgi:hypothetical protein
MGTLAVSLVPQNLQTWESEADISGICPMAPARKISIACSAGDPLLAGTNFSAVLSVPSTLWYPNVIAGRRDHDLPARKGTPPSLRARKGMKILSGILWGYCHGSEDRVLRPLPRATAPENAAYFGDDRGHPVTCGPHLG